MKVKSISVEWFDIELKNRVQSHDGHYDIFTFSDSENCRVQSDNWDFDICTFSPGI